jgi:hypothetical protein
MGVLAEVSFTGGLAMANLCVLLAERDGSFKPYKVTWKELDGSIKIAAFNKDVPRHRFVVALRDRGIEDLRTYTESCELPEPKGYAKMASYC